MLDDFSRPDGNLTTAQGWTKADVAFTGTLNVTSRRLASDISGFDMCYWSRAPAAFTDSEAWVTASVSGDPHGVVTRLTGGSGSLVGYAWWWRSSSGGQLVLSRITASSLTTNILTTTAWPSNTGVQMLLQTIGSQIIGFAKKPNDDWVQITTVTDANHASGAIAVLAQNSVVRLANFGGGTIDSLVPGAHPISGFGAT
jgi:hypothetical protein